MTDKIFISYRRFEGLKEAGHLKTLLGIDFGAKNVFLDTIGIPGGRNWRERIRDEVTDSTVMVVLIGVNWANLKDEQGRRRLDDPDDTVRFEILQALRSNIPIVPVLLDGAPFLKPDQLPSDIIPLTLFQAMQLRTDSFESDAEAIAKQLRDLVVTKRRNGCPLWAVALVILGAAVAGGLTGPIILNGLGVKFPGVALPDEVQVRTDLAAARLKTEQVQNAQEDLVKEYNNLSNRIANLKLKAIRATIGEFNPGGGLFGGCGTDINTLVKQFCGTAPRTFTHRMSDKSGGQCGYADWIIACADY